MLFLSPHTSVMINLKQPNIWPGAEQSPERIRNRATRPIPLSSIKSWFWVTPRLFTASELPLLRNPAVGGRYCAHLGRYLTVGDAPKASFACQQTLHHGKLDIDPGCRARHRCSELSFRWPEPKPHASSLSHARRPDILTVLDLHKRLKAFV